ncbi:MAG: XRE family transcriptional regulator [Thermodesulfobacteriota bacterium]
MDQSDFINKVKNLRSAKGYSLNQLSKRSGLTKGYLSKIENGVSTPTLTTLHKLAAALGVDSTYFLTGNDLGQANSKIVYVRKDQRKEIHTDIEEIGIKKRWPLADQKLGRNMDPYIIEIPPDHCQIYQFEGEEFHYILEGKVEFIYGGERYLFEEGDCVYIDGDVPYTGRSLGEKPAKTITIIYHYKKVTGERFSHAVLPNKIIKPGLFDNPSVKT